MKCDFCSSTLPAWRYDTDDQLIALAAGELARAAMHSTGGWTACDTCRTLIERDERELLASYSAARSQPYSNLSFAAAKEMCKGIQAAFWAARRGPPVRLEARPVL